MADPTGSIPPPPPPGAGGVPGATSPVAVDFVRDDKVANWRPLLNWLLAIPHLVILYFLTIVERALTLLSLLLVLFTRRIPDPIFDFRVMVYRYQWRVFSYVLFMRDEYPPFAFGVSEIDDGLDAARLSVAHPGEMQRWAPLYKWLLALPHYIVLAFLAIGVSLAMIVAFFAVLFTGKFPRGIRDFVVGTMRWGTRVVAYVALLTDEYPPFRLS